TSMRAAIRMSAPHDPPTLDPDPDELSAWIENHQLWLWRYLRFLGAAADLAEDMCQETLLAALHHQIPTRERGVAIAWLRATACNFYRKQLRRARKQVELSQLMAMDRLVTTDDLLHNAFGRDYQDALRECLGKVS